MGKINDNIIHYLLHCYLLAWMS